MLPSYNPFSQSPHTYVLLLKVFYKYIDEFVNFFEQFSETISYFEAEETNNIEIQDNDIWQINIYLDTKPDLPTLQQNITNICNKLNIQNIPFSLEKIQDIDWVSEVQKNFKPIEAGKFFVCTTNYHEKIPIDSIEIRIDAGRAFGTGEHNSTANCLRAISELEYIPNKSLDLGCGSGILAIALQKLGNKQVFAVDIDEQAVLVTQENAILNNTTQIKTSCSNGYEGEFVKENAPFDLIVANILAKPLMDMADLAFKNLVPGGILIIAGILKKQQEMVCLQHISCGFKIIKEVCSDEWPAVVLQKSIINSNVNEK